MSMMSLHVHGFAHDMSFAFENGYVHSMTMVYIAPVCWRGITFG
jgi:hypothetical protein